MARIRTIKPEFFRSRSLAKCDREVRLTFVGLWTEADDHGRGVADSRILKGAIWPLDDDITHLHISAHLRVLVATGHIRLYEVAGETYYEVVNWDKHQAAAYRRGGPKHPAPETYLNDVSHHGVQEDADGTSKRAGTGTGTGKGTGKGTTTSDVPPDGDDPPDVSVDARELTRQFAVAVKANGHPVPDPSRKAHADWLIEMDRLLRLGPPGWDGDPPGRDEVATVIAWAASDEFERANIQAVPKFRKRYSQLRLKALNGQQPHSASPSRAEAEFGSPEWEERQAALRERERAILGADE